MTTSAARALSLHADHQIAPTAGPDELGTGPGQAPMRRVVAILTAHDRREMTLACLHSYFSQEVPGIELRAVLLDDGSSDGTATRCPPRSRRLRSFPPRVICSGRAAWPRPRPMRCGRPGLPAVAQR